MVLLTSTTAHAVEFPSAVTEVRYHVALDNTLQPALFYAPDAGEAVPLLVALHTWGGDYGQAYNAPLAHWCVEHDWVFIQPSFRGPNTRPEACGSDLAVGDVRDAVLYAMDKANIDPRRVYLVGASGGGHMALLMAGRAPHLWAGVSAWVPVTDLRAWYRELREMGNSGVEDIVAVTGGIPAASPQVDKQYDARSPLTHLAKAADVPLDINAGIRDGHDGGGVPISHSLHAFNLLARQEDRLTQQQIDHLTRTAEVPPLLVRPPAALQDPSYGDKQPLLRRTSNNVRVTIFNGEHEMIPGAALSWLRRQRKGSG